MDPRTGLDGGKSRRHPPTPRGFDPRTVQPVAQSLYRLSCPVHKVQDVMSSNNLKRASHFGEGETLLIGCLLQSGSRRVFCRDGMELLASGKGENFFTS